MKIKLTRWEQNLEYGKESEVRDRHQLRFAITQEVYLNGITCVDYI